MHPDLEPRPAFGRRLRELPEPAAPPYGYREFERRSRERPRALTGSGAVAVSAVLSLGILALWIRLGGSAPNVPSLRAEPDEAQQLAAHGSDMQRWLERLPDEPAVIRLGTHAAVTGLEDRIAQLDDLLTAEQLEAARPAQLLALQQERTRLVGALVEVRYAETLADASR